MPIKIKGIISLIDKDLEAEVKYTSMGSFYEIPMSMANLMVRQGKNKKPIRFEHFQHLPSIGEVYDVYISRKYINNEERDVLMMEGSINNGAFIKVMREIGEEYNTKDEPCPYFSPDEFIKGGLKKATDLTCLEYRYLHYPQYNLLL